ncbi:hypothetical protein D3Y55_20995 [Mesorhizobium sp. DCY119]|nr:hypothetical protein D3Y55_20995 [Mesorhizobium sp. DCY119]
MVFWKTRTDLRPNRPAGLLGQFKEQPVQQHTTIWDRHAILAEIKRRHGSLKKFAATTPVSASEISAALGSPYPKAEKAISLALGVSLPALWPDRYWPNGRRRTTPSRSPHIQASQKDGRHADREGTL